MASAMVRRFGAGREGCAPDEAARFGTLISGFGSSTRMPAFRAWSSMNFARADGTASLNIAIGCRRFFPPSYHSGVIAALGMVFVPAFDENVVPDDPAVAFDDRGEGPPALDLDHLDDVDAVRIGLRSCHCLFPPWGKQVARDPDSIKCAIRISSKSSKRITHSLNAERVGAQSGMRGQLIGSAALPE